MLDMRFITIKNLGTLLVILSLGFFLVLGFPLLRMYLFPPDVVMTNTPSEQFTLTIPKISAQAPVIPMVDPWDRKTYNEALKYGVAHAEGTGLPGDGKTIFLFAHSTGSPWEQLYYNTIFLRLGELRPGDEITIDLAKKRYQYRVTELKEVWPNEIKYLQETNKNQLILQTCTPIGTALKRLLVFAEPI